MTRGTGLERETDIQYGCKRLLEAVGFWVGTLSQGRATRQSAGLPDLLALHPRAGVVFLECKQAHGVQSAAQAKFQARCQAAQVPYVVARSVAELQGYLRGSWVAPGASPAAAPPEDLPHQ